MVAEALTMAPVIWPLIFPLGLALLWEYRHREREFQSRSKFVIASMLIGGLVAVPYCLIVGGLFWGVIRGETLLAFGVCTLAGGSVLGASIAWSVWSPKKKTCCDQ